MSLYSASEYLKGLQSLMPRGRAWPRDPDATLTKLLSGFCPTLVALDTTAQGLIVDSNPSTTVEMLPEWEAALGLPDPCLGGNPTLEQRQAAVRARFTAVGSESAAFLIQYAAQLGYTITVTPQAPFRVGISGMGDPVGDEGSFTELLITCAALDSIIECELNAIKPAHVTFIYQV